MIYLIGKDDPFPPIEEALEEPNGLLAVGGDLSPQRLLYAYRLGIFPWFNPGDPILWWSPNPRMVLHLEDLKISRSLKKSLARADIEIRFDTAFRQVMENCALPRKNQDGTWISSAMIDAYCNLHAMGYAHSVEVYQHGTLCAGLYGIAMGKIFFGESMFTHIRDGSKVALVHLVSHLQEKGYLLIDCQVVSEHLSRLGAKTMDRKDFNRLLQTAIGSLEPGAWHDTSIAVSDKRPNNHDVLK
jgi:leucyl/phenylalanyl-tRNA--protein transferase